jgi:hypothetical protein
MGTLNFPSNSTLLPDLLNALELRNAGTTGGAIPAATQKDGSVADFILFRGVRQPVSGVVVLSANATAFDSFPVMTKFTWPPDSYN